MSSVSTATARRQPLSPVTSSPPLLLHHDSIRSMRPAGSVASDQHRSFYSASVEPQGDDYSGNDTVSGWGSPPASALGMPPPAMAAALSFPRRLSQRRTGTMTPAAKRRLHSRQRARTVKELPMYGGGASYKPPARDFKPDESLALGCTTVEPMRSSVTSAGSARGRISGATSRHSSRAGLRSRGGNSRAGSSRGGSRVGSRAASRANSRVGVPVATAAQLSSTTYGPGMDTVPTVRAATAIIRRSKSRGDDPAPRTQARLAVVGAQERPGVELQLQGLHRSVSASVLLFNSLGHSQVVATGTPGPPGEIPARWETPVHMIPPSFREGLKHAQQTWDRVPKRPYRLAEHYYVDPSTSDRASSTSQQEAGAGQQQQQQQLGAGHVHPNQEQQPQPQPQPQAQAQAPSESHTTAIQLAAMNASTGHAGRNMPPANSPRYLARSHLHWRPRHARLALPMTPPRSPAVGSWGTPDSMGSSSRNSLMSGTLGPSTAAYHDSSATNDDVGTVGQPLQPRPFFAMQGSPRVPGMQQGAPDPLTVYAARAATVDPAKPARRLRMGLLEGGDGAAQVQASEALARAASPGKRAITRDSRGGDGAGRVPGVLALAADPVRGERQMNRALPLPAEVDETPAMDTRVGGGGGGAATASVSGSDGGDPLTGTDTRAQRRQSAASNTVDAYLSRSGRADKRLSTHVKILGEPTPIAGTVYVTATVRLRGCTAQVFQKHLLLKILGAFGEVLSLRVPSLTDEDVDIVDVKNIGAGGAVGLRDINGSDAVRAKAISTTARMATGKVVAIQLAKMQDPAEVVGQAERAARAALLQEGRVQSHLFGALGRPTGLETMLAMEQERQAADRLKRAEGQQARIAARLKAKRVSPSKLRREAKKRQQKRDQRKLQKQSDGTPSPSVTPTGTHHRRRSAVSITNGPVAITLPPGSAAGAGQQGAGGGLGGLVGTVPGTPGASRRSSLHSASGGTAARRSRRGSAASSVSHSSQPSHTSQPPAAAPMVGGKRDSVSRALQKVTNIMSALGGEDSLLGHIYLTSDRHSIPVNYPQSFYKASNWEGRLLTQNPAATGLDQLDHAYDGRIAAWNMRNRSQAAIRFHVRAIVVENEVHHVRQVMEACMTDGSLDLVKLDALLRNPPPPRHSNGLASHASTQPNTRAVTPDYKLGRGAKTAAAPAAPAAPAALAQQPPTTADIFPPRPDDAIVVVRTQHGEQLPSTHSSRDLLVAAPGMATPTARVAQMAASELEAAKEAVLQRPPSKEEMATLPEVLQRSSMQLRVMVEEQKAVAEAAARKRAHRSGLERGGSRGQGAGLGSPQRLGSPEAATRLMHASTRSMTTFKPAVKAYGEPTTGTPTCRRCRGASCAHKATLDRSRLASPAIVFRAPNSQAGRGFGVGPGGVLPLPGARLDDPLWLDVDPSKTTKGHHVRRSSTDSGGAGSAGGMGGSEAAHAMVTELATRIFTGEAMLSANGEPKVPVLHATPGNLMRVTLKCQNDLPIHTSMLNAASKELREMSKESKFVRRHMEAGARHAVQEYYKAKTKLQDCKMQIRKVLYEMEEPILSRPSSSNRR